MPPKVKNTHRDLSAADKELHEELFTKAVRGARTMREMHELLRDGTPIPTYHYGSGNTQGVALTDVQRIYLNSEVWGTGDSEILDHFAAQAVRDIVEGWPGVIEEIGEPKATDKSLQWSAYDLLRISSLVTISLGLLDHAIAWDNRHPQEQSVS